MKVTPTPPSRPSLSPALRPRSQMITTLVPHEHSEIPPLLLPFHKKPILMRDTGTVYKGSHYLEVDINTHHLNLVAGLGHVGPQLLFTKMEEMSTQIGFVIEGRADQELPETLCGCVGVNHIRTEDLDHFQEEA
jgi:hypothetical protein